MSRTMSDTDKTDDDNAQPGFASAAQPEQPQQKDDSEDVLNQTGTAGSSNPTTAMDPTPFQAGGMMNSNQYLDEQQRLIMMENQRQSMMRQGGGDHASFQQQLAARNQQIMNQQQMFLNNPNNANTAMNNPMNNPMMAMMMMSNMSGGGMNPDFMMLANSGMLPHQQPHPGMPLPPQDPQQPPPPPHQPPQAWAAGMNPPNNFLPSSVGTNEAFMAMQAQAEIAKQLEKTNKGRGHHHHGAPEAPDAPIRPLSAYNFFFRDERERILSGDTVENAEQKEERYQQDRKKTLLQQHLSKDRTTRRPHRKTHGKIGFTTLSKEVGKRWRELPHYEKEFYRDVAAMDMERYQKDVADFNRKRLRP